MNEDSPSSKLVRIDTGLIDEAKELVDLLQITRETRVHRADVFRMALRRGFAELVAEEAAKGNVKPSAAGA